MNAGRLRPFRARFDELHAYYGTQLHGTH